jgi:formylmethanofuran dehydrogenase subunit B
VVRYSVFSRGRFTERGVEDRQVAAVDIYRTETAKFCNLFIQIEPGQELALVRGVRAALAGRPGREEVSRSAR